MLQAFIVLGQSLAKFFWGLLVQKMILNLIATSWISFAFFVLATILMIRLRDRANRKEPKRIVIAGFCEKAASLPMVLLAIVGFLYFFTFVGNQAQILIFDIF